MADGGVMKKIFDSVKHGTLFLSDFWYGLTTGEQRFRDEKGLYEKSPYGKLYYHYEYSKESSKWNGKGIDPDTPVWLVVLEAIFFVKVLLPVLGGGVR
jgi:hypothetical protein